jgi:hypothetical protein
MLWAITSYFNPSKYRTRLLNYRRFRALLKVPLVTVEASFDGHFELGPGDAEILVQRRAQAVLWQKERLLNVAFDFLPAECTDVAWIDCDVIFAEDDWPERARAALREKPLIHLFSERCNLERQATSDPSKRPRIDSATRSIGVVIAAGLAAPEDLYDANAQLVSGTTSGLAWAARRASVQNHRLYDVCILGGGDRAMLCAALGEFGYGARAGRMTARQVAHYRAWATRFYAIVRGRVGYIDGQAFHLWHGDLRDRKYDERVRPLRHFGFDPFKDIALDREGCWRWATPKTDMHEYIKGYFDSRHEDGVAADEACAASTARAWR